MVIDSANSSHGLLVREIDCESSGPGFESRLWQLPLQGTVGEHLGSVSLSSKLSSIQSILKIQTFN